MIKHTQQILGDPARGDGHNAEGRPGDCWKTCIASLLNVGNLDDVPHFLELEDWWLETQAYVQSIRGGEYVLDWWEHLAEVPGTPEFMIASGDSPRGNFQHAVITNGAGEIIHDPHPSRLGLVGRPTQYFAVVRWNEH